MYDFTVFYLFICFVYLFFAGRQWFDVIQTFICRCRCCSEVTIYAYKCHNGANG